MKTRNDLVLVTVVVITYNQEKYIRDTLDSILGQEVDFRYKIVIADDCSPDSTMDICMDYVEKYPDIVSYFRRDKNLKAVRNIIFSLLEKCNSNYIALCAGDDLWIDKFKLHKQVELMKSSKDISVVLTGYRKLYEGSESYEDINEWISPLLLSKGKKMIKHVLLENFSFFPVGSSLLFRSVILDKLRECYPLYETTNAPGEAMILFPLFCLYGKYAFLNDVTTAYRIRLGSLSHQVSPEKKIEFDIKYAIQKINVANYFNLSLHLRIKLAIKLFFLYLYSIRRDEDAIFSERLNTLSRIERTISVRMVSRLTIVLSKCSLMRNFVMLLFDWLKR